MIIVTVLYWGVYQLSAVCVQGILELVGFSAYLFLTSLVLPHKRHTRAVLELLQLDLYDSCEKKLHHTCS